MKKFYITFGPKHGNTIGDKTFDKETVAVIMAASAYAARDRANEIFNKKYLLISEDEPDMKKYPKGLINL